MATASGRGSVTSTPMMESAGRATPFLSFRWMQEMLRTASAEWHWRSRSLTASLFCQASVLRL
eukprot:3359243-Heterocapsa_arctica.AAC.1